MTLSTFIKLKDGSIKTDITIDDIKEIPTESFYFLKKDLEKFEEPEESISFFDLVRNHHHK